MFRPVIQSLQRHPGANVAVVLTLSFALASTVLISGLLNTFLLAPLPQIDDRGIMLIGEYDLELGPTSRTRASWDTVMDVRRELNSFSRTALVTNASFTVHGGDATEVAYIPNVSPEFFDLFGIKAALGSIIHEDNALVDGQLAFVLSHDLWLRRFGGRTNVIGQSVRLDDSSAQIVGVLPPNFSLPLIGSDPQGWVAMQPERVNLQDRTARRHFQFAELKPGVSPHAAAAEVAALGESLRVQFADTNENRGLSARPLREAMVGPFQRQLWILLITSVLVLLVACLNSGALLLAQALRRRRELAVRLALGARAGHLLRLFWLENLALTLCAALLSLVLAAWAGPLILALLPPNTGVDSFAAPSINFTSWFVALGASIAVALLFGLMPWMIARHLSIDTTLRGGGRTVDGGFAGRLSRWLVTGQIAVALALAVGAALLVTSSQKLAHINYGFPVDELHQFRLGTRGDIREDEERRLRFFENVTRDMAQLPGITAASVSTFSFPNAPASYRPFIQEGDGLTIRDTPKQALMDSVSPSYFDTHDVRLLRGRKLLETDRRDHPFVTVVSAELAERYWPDRDPIGKRVRLDTFPGEWFTIVGVISDRISSGVQPQVVDTFLVPMAQVTQPNCAVFIRYQGAEPPATNTLERVVWNLDPDMSIFFEAKVGEFHRASQWQQRFSMILIGAFATLAITLCAGGLYAVLAFAVGARTREIGVRTALGASHHDIRGHILRDAGTMIIPGLVLGSLLAIVTGQSLGNLLFEVPQISPLIYAATAIFLTLICLLAAWIPAHRATLVDPAEALRSE